MSDSTHNSFILIDGVALALYDWPLPLRVRPRAVVLIVHGLGEHAGRYVALAQRLNDWGFCVRAYDQRGHGESNGARGVLAADNILLQDLGEVLRETRAQLSQPWSCPLILLGHSMGGLVAAALVERQPSAVDALVLSSPALDLGLGAWQKFMLSLRYRLAPDLTLSSRLDPSKISHAPAVFEAYRNDELVHRRVSARLLRFMERAGARVLAAAPNWRTPTLLLYAGADELVRPAGSRAFAAAAPGHQVRSHCFEQMYHEVFNETDPSAVYAALIVWLDQLIPRR